VLDALVEDFARHFVERVTPGPASEEIGAIIGDGLGGDAAGGPGANPPLQEAEAFWPRLVKMPPPRLAEVIGGEHPAIAAAVFSALAPGAVAAILSETDAAFRAAVTGRMLTCAPPSAPVLRALEVALWGALAVEDPGVRVTATRRKVAAALNGLGREAASTVLDDLRRTDAESADALAAMLFDFDDVLRLDPAARSILFDGQPADRVITALHGAGAEMTAAVLGALGARARRMAEAELANGTAPPAATINAARRAIADAALQLADEGRIALNSGDGSV
jgi:flagellar motor switch protein FliG